MVVHKAYRFNRLRPLCMADQKPRPIFGRRVFHSDEDVGSAPAPSNARNPGALPSPTSQLFFDAFSGRADGGVGFRGGESPIELSSDSGDDCMVQTAPRTQPRHR